MYLDVDDLTIRRKVDGYLNRYKKDDIVVPFVSSNGYLRLQIPKTRATINMAHTYYLLRKIPLPTKFLIDHIDGDKANHERDNLRIVNHKINNCNRAMRSDNTSGITGVQWSDYHQHYVIRRTIKGKRLSRSRKTIEEAKIVLAELCTMDDMYTERHGK